MVAHDGDGWVYCAAGHKHWGRFGAAGLLLRGPAGVVLQHRAAWTHEGDRWGLPGGARDSHEDALTAARREAEEEAAIPPVASLPIASYRDDHDGWSYTTVIADAVTTVQPVARNAESVDVRWWSHDELAGLALHPGLAAAWPTLSGLQRPRVIVDAANVIGARPDGWWRDRAAAAERLLTGLRALVRRGLAATELDPGSAARWVWPSVQVVLEGAARAARPAPPTAPSDTLVSVVAASGSGDDTVVALATADAAAVVVTADRGLRARVAGSPIHGPSWLWHQLDRTTTADPDG